MSDWPPRVVAMRCRELGASSAARSRISRTNGNGTSCRRITPSVRTHVRIRQCRRSSARPRRSITGLPSQWITFRRGRPRPAPARPAVNGLTTCISQRWPTCRPGSRSSGPRMSLNTLRGSYVDATTFLFRIGTGPWETISIFPSRSSPMTCDQLVAEILRAHARDRSSAGCPTDRHDNGSSTSTRRLSRIASNASRSAGRPRRNPPGWSARTSRRAGASTRSPPRRPSGDSPSRAPSITWMLHRTGRFESLAKAIPRKSGGYPIVSSGSTSHFRRQNAAIDQ